MSAHDLPCGCRTAPVERLCSYHEGYRDGLEAERRQARTFIADRITARAVVMHYACGCEGPGDIRERCSVGKAADELLKIAAAIRGDA